MVRFRISVPGSSANSFPPWMKMEPESSSRIRQISCGMEMARGAEVFRSFAELAVKPDLRKTPIAFDSGQRDSQCVCDLVQLKTAEKTHFHDLARSRTQSLKVAERVIQRDQIASRRRGALDSFFKRYFDEPPLAAVGVYPAVVIDQKPAHQARGGGEEVLAIAVLDLFVEKPQVD